MKLSNHRIKDLAWIVLSLVIFSSALTQTALSHPGGFDSQGGHQSTQGGYHFHKGPLAEKTFPSKEAALQALNSFAPALKLGSFNIRVFSNNSRSDAELGLISQILAKFDIIAIQELRDEQVLQRTKEILEKLSNAEWNYELSGPVGRGVKERYAFLFRKDRIEVKTKGKNVDNTTGRFIREPYYATFKSGLFDFTLITIHALYKTKDAPERKLEFDALAEVYQNIQTEDPDEQDIILLGDFNDSSDHTRFRAVMAIPGMKCLILPPLKTTISDSSLYDNFCFQGDYVTEYSGDSGVFMFDEEMFNNDDHAASLSVSDHRPIWATFMTNRDDD